jgi:hypothetical protein
MAAVAAVRRAALAWTLALASIVVLGAPGVASAAPARQDSVTGAGSTDFFTNVRIDVGSGLNGENPTGRVSFDVPSNNVHVVNAAITCLNVSGHFATIGLTVPGFGGVIIGVADNGPASSGFDTVSLQNVNVDPTVCPQPFGGIGSLTGGDIVVTDASLKPGMGCGDENHMHAGSVLCTQKRLSKGVTQDSVTGRGDFTNSGFTNLALDIRSGPNGEQPTGSLAVTVAILGGARLEAASITCLAVRGGAATIGGTVKPNTVGITAAVVQVSDNEAFGVPDGFSAAPVTSAPTTCPPPTPFTTSGATGDIVVRDAGFKPNP